MTTSLILIININILQQAVVVYYVHILFELVEINMCNPTFVKKVNQKIKKSTFHVFRILCIWTWSAAFHESFE